MKSATVTLELTQHDLELILQGLGMLHHDRSNRGKQLRPIEYLFTKIYRAMGVKI